MIHCSDPIVLTKFRKIVKKHKNATIPSRLLEMLLPFDPPLFTGWDEYDDDE